MSQKQVIKSFINQESNEIKEESRSRIIIPPTVPEGTFTPSYAHPIHHPNTLKRQKHPLQQQCQEDYNKQQMKERQEQMLNQEEYERQKQFRIKQIEKQQEMEKQAKQRQEEYARHKNVEEEIQRRCKEERERMKQMEKERKEKMQKMYLENSKKLNEINAYSQIPSGKDHLNKNSYQKLDDRRNEKLENKHLPGNLGRTRVGESSSYSLSSDWKLTPPDEFNVQNAMDLQSQLDELDHYIAQLSQSFDTKVNDDGEDIKPIKTSSIGSEGTKNSLGTRSLSTDHFFSSTSSSSGISMMQCTLPNPPTRSSSSYDSVSRRLSHGNDINKINCNKSSSYHGSISDVGDKEIELDDHVFESNQQNSPVVSSHHLQQRINSVQKQPTDVAIEREEKERLKSRFHGRLHSDVIDMIAVNPGGRPNKDNKKYKENNFDQGFITKNTKVPVGLTATPLSALKLSPSAAINNLSTNEKDFCFSPTKNETEEMTSLMKQFDHITVTDGSDDVIEKKSGESNNNRHSSKSSNNRSSYSSFSTNHLLNEQAKLQESLMAHINSEENVLDNQVICGVDDAFLSSCTLSSTNGMTSSSRECQNPDSISSLQSSSTGDGHHNIISSGDISGMSTSTSGRTSSSSVSDVDKLTRDLSRDSTHLGGFHAPKFIKDTSNYWYKPDITRKQALLMLRDKPPGSFVVRDSRFFPGAFGLALKVHQVPPAVLATAEPGTDMNDELIRHYLIEPSTRGVKIKGCLEEPSFGSLSALIYQHSITNIALPCKLIIPTSNMEVIQVAEPGPATPVEVPTSAADLLEQGAACNVLFLGSADTESLTGPEAIERAMRECTENSGQAIKTSVVQFKVSAQGITLTDNARKIFFRRHYPVSSLTFCGMDPSAREPHNRRWNATQYNGPREARVFGFVAKRQGSNVQNGCHLFAELDTDQPATAIVNFVSKVLIGSQRT